MSKNNRTSSAASSDSIEIRNYPASLIHEHVSSDDGSVFKTLSFRFKDAWASLILPEGSAFFRTTTHTSVPLCSIAQFCQQ